MTAPLATTFRVLGPLGVSAGGEVLALGGPKQRAVLALLLLDNGHAVSVDRITEALWGDEAGDGTRNVVQVYVSNLRRALEPAAAALGLEAVIRTQRPGYATDVPADELDLAVFERLTAAARRTAQAGDPRTASAQLGEALALWHGDALADLVEEEPSLAAATVRLAAARLTASIDRLELEIGLGHHREVLHDSAALVAANPLDERLRGLHMIALYRSGRQADALEAYQEGRRLLVEELGIDPGPELRGIEALILQQASELAAPAPGAGFDRDLSTMIGSSVLAPRAALVLDGRRFPLDRSVTTIGRRADRTIVLDDTKASRAHAEVRRATDGFVLIDTASTNGTRVNGVKIEGTATLVPGDEIGIGASTLVFETT